MATQEWISHKVIKEQYFHKVERPGRSTRQGKNTVFHWEIIPEQRAALGRELENILKEEEKSSSENGLYSSAMTGEVVDSVSLLCVAIINSSKDLSETHLT